MATPQYQRFYILPAATATVAGREGTVPAYVHADGRIAGFSAVEIEPAALEAHYPALLQTNSNVERWFVARVFADGDAGWQALNEISVQADTRNLAQRPGVVAAVLNARLDLDRDAEQWAQSLRIQRRTP
jgi:hypothetical protein